jgi:hypothetical protein
MRRTLLAIVALAAIPQLAGCCAGPNRFWENAYGFNNPEQEHYKQGPPPPVTTPPGFYDPALHEHTEEAKT